MKTNFWILGTALVLILVAGILHFNHYEIFSAGRFSMGFFAAGDFSIGVFSAGMFSIGIFSAGIFSIGVFSIGIFNIALYAIGIFIIAKKYKKAKLCTDEKTI
ncbi:MAG TPA: hypothetical protein DDX39_11775 [Bacteroidales bacterium]|nr:MAG: hypothetical protein A2W98_10150 [Bacteroidetes bacterium GWF2_33_38]OFY76357.1 MAG: hypothetical protein A2265_11890 [Bacteroidetes bacterium RIFOXYA12_FULL_33_9]OFY89991.1 MAG: hypothetical protein A2236_08180 [Bacteroidetes bacterium RIFOXYA2_FULL_33_7]HBF89310.1 hypothetical protein [Bacteroidales bacterium]